MENKLEEDAKLYGHLQNLFLYHERLLRDEVRNVLFHKALKRVVNKDSRVLDIGAGSGVWAIMAAKFGAKKVVAIEGDSSLIPLIQAHAAENGVADKVEVINGISTEIKLRGRFDVIVSETIGNQAFDEAIIPTMIDAKKRFLAPGGVMIPQTVELVAAPAHLSSETETPLGVPLKTELIKQLAKNMTFRVDDRSRLKLLGEAHSLLNIDLTTIKTEPTYSGFTAEWDMSNIGRSNVIALWARSRLLKGIELDVWETTNWSPVVCRFEPFPMKKGKLRFELNLNNKQYHWTVTAESKAATLKRSYSPIFAFAKIKFASGATTK